MYMKMQKTQHSQSKHEEEGKKIELILSDIKTLDKIQITEECYQWKKKIKNIEKRTQK